MKGKLREHYFRLLKQKGVRWRRH